MRNLLGSLAIAFSMYSAIPVPQVEWTKERMRFALCFFPLIGLVTGVVNYGVYSLLWNWNFRVFAVAAPVILPIVLTGGIHMDGFLDVIDAKSSHAEQEKKLEILKDPHIGAFAIIWAGVYFVAYAAAIGEMRPWMMKAAGAVFVLTRALSGLAVVTFPMAKKSGLAASFSGQADKKAVALVMGVYALAAAAYIWYAGGITAFIVSVILALFVYGSYYRMSKREFGGITGDLAGYFLQVCEFFLILGLAVVSRVG